LRKSAASPQRAGEDMTLMHRTLLFALLASAGLSMACTPPAEAACNKMAGCGKVSDVEECVETLNGDLEILWAKKKDVCDQIADAYEDVYACVADLTCDQLEDDAGCLQVRAAKAALAAQKKECRAES